MNPKFWLKINNSAENLRTHNIADTPPTHPKSVQGFQVEVLFLSSLYHFFSSPVNVYQSPFNLSSKQLFCCWQDENRQAAEIFLVQIFSQYEFDKDRLLLVWIAVVLFCIIGYQVTFKSNTMLHKTLVVNLFSFFLFPSF